MRKFNILVDNSFIYTITACLFYALLLNLWCVMATGSFVEGQIVFHNNIEVPFFFFLIKLMVYVTPGSGTSLDLSFFVDNKHLVYALVCGVLYAIGAFLLRSYIIKKLAEVKATGART